MPSSSFQDPGPHMRRECRRHDLIVLRIELIDDKLLLDVAQEPELCRIAGDKREEDPIELRGARESALPDDILYLHVRICKVLQRMPYPYPVQI